MLVYINDENQQPQSNKEGQQRAPQTPGQPSEPIKDVFNETPSKGQGQGQDIKPNADQQIAQDHVEASRIGAAQGLATLGTRPVNAPPPGDPPRTSYGLPSCPTPVGSVPRPRSRPHVPVARATPTPVQYTTPWPPTPAGGQPTPTWTGDRSRARYPPSYTYVPASTHVIEHWVRDVEAQKDPSLRLRPGTILPQTPGGSYQHGRNTIPTPTARARPPTGNLAQGAEISTNTPKVNFDDESGMSGVEDQSPNYAQDDSLLVKQEMDDAMDTEHEVRMATDPRLGAMLPPSSTARPTQRRATLSHPRHQPYPNHGPHATPGAALKRGRAEVPATTGPMRTSTSLQHVPGQTPRNPTGTYPAMAELGHGHPSQGTPITRKSASDAYARKWGVSPSVLEPAAQVKEFGFSSIQTHQPQTTARPPPPSNLAQSTPAIRTPSNPMRTTSATQSRVGRLGADGEMWYGIVLPRVQATQADMSATPGAVDRATEQLARARLAATPGAPPPKPPKIPIPTPGNYGDELLHGAQQALRNMETHPDTVNFADLEHFNIFIRYLDIVSLGPLVDGVGRRMAELITNFVTDLTEYALYLRSIGKKVPEAISRALDIMRDRCIILFGQHAATTVICEIKMSQVDKALADEAAEAEMMDADDEE